MRRKLGLIALLLAGGLGGAAQTQSETMTLSQALDLADKASPDVQSARLAALESAAAAVSVNAARRPQVNFSLATAVQTSNLQGIGLIAPGIPSRIGPYRTFDTRPTASWRVWDLSLLAQVKAAQARTKQNEAQAAAIAEQTRAAVIDLYLQTLEADTQLRANQARIATAEAVLSQTNDSEQAGRSSKLDVARATQQLEKERASLVELTRQRDVLNTMLQKTIGIEARAPVPLAEVPAHAFAWDVSRDALVHEALDVRPERRVTAAKGTVLDREIEQADKQRWPKLDVLANYGLSGQGPDKALGTWDVAASLTVPVWTAGRIENDVKAARYRRDQWKEDDRREQQAIEQEVTEALIEGRAAEEQSKHLALAEGAARETLELARLRYQSGLATNLDVVTAQGELAEAEEDLIRVRYQGLLAEAKVARARGNVRLFADKR